MKTIASWTLEEWFEGTKINKLCNDVLFGHYKIFLDEGVLLLKNMAEGRIDIISTRKLGLSGEISKNSKLVLSEVRECSENSGNAGFFLIDAGLEKAVYISMSYSKEEVNIRTTDYELGFTLSDDYDASAKDGYLIVIDRKTKKYIMIMPEGNTLSAFIQFHPGSGCYMVSKNLAVITNANEVYIIHDKTRDLIDIDALCIKNGSKLKDAKIGLGKTEDILWLALEDRKWKKQVLLVALDGDEKFCYTFCNKN